MYILVQTLKCVHNIPRNKVVKSTFMNPLQKTHSSPHLPKKSGDTEGRNKSVLYIKDSYLFDSNSIQYLRNNLGIMKQLLNI